MSKQANILYPAQQASEPGNTTITPGIDTDPHGFLYTGGYVSGAGNPDLGIISLMGEQDSFVCKHNPDGTLAWTYQIGGTIATCAVRSVVVGEGGNVYAIGVFLDASLDTPALTLGPYQSAFLIKLSPTGTLIWAQVIEALDEVFCPFIKNHLAFDFNDNALYAILSYKGDLVAPYHPLVGTQDTVVIKYDTSGAVIWSQNFGGAGVTTSGGCVSIDTVTDNVHVAFTRNGQLSVPLTTTGGSNTSVTLFELNKSDGSVVQYQSFLNNATAVLNNMVACQGGGVFLCASWTSGSITTPPHAVTNYGSVLLKLDPSYGILWKKLSIPAGTVRTASLVITPLSNGYSAWTFRVFNTGTDITLPFSMPRVGTFDAVTCLLDYWGNLMEPVKYQGASAQTWINHAAFKSNNYLASVGYLEGSDLTAPEYIPNIGTYDQIRFKNSPKVPTISYFNNCETANINEYFGNGCVFTSMTTGTPVVTITSPFGTSCWRINNLDANNPEMWYESIYGDFHELGSVHSYVLRCMARLDSTSVSQTLITKWEDGFGSCFILGFRQSTTPYWYFATRNNSGGTDILNVPQTVPIGAWFEIEATYNAVTRVKTITVQRYSGPYITAAAATARQTVASHSNNPAIPVRIGASYDFIGPARGLRGAIDNIYIGKL